LEREQGWLEATSGRGDHRPENQCPESVADHTIQPCAGRVDRLFVRGSTYAGAGKFAVPASGFPLWAEADAWKFWLRPAGVETRERCFGSTKATATFQLRLQRGAAVHAGTRPQGGTAHSFWITPQSGTAAHSWLWA
jgi:hypothetical protein